ncbi:MAG: YdjY domain-containing protein [Planctomycetota bacterium]
MTQIAPRTALLALALPLALAGRAPESKPAAGPQEGGDAQAALTALLEEGGVRLDHERGTVSIAARALVRYDLLEYLLVAPGGAAHESLFVTDIQPSLLNAGLLAIGAQVGTNASWERIDPPPTLEERRAGKRPYRVFPPEGPEGQGLLLYVAWREGDETFFFRVEDLVANLETGRSMRRHPWVYLGSTFLEDDDGQEVFAADVEGNLINISFFREGHTLMTPALPECEDQSIWMPNAWLVPPRDAGVELIFSSTPLTSLPDEWRDRLPVVDPAALEQQGEPDDSEGAEREQRR